MTLLWLKGKKDEVIIGGPSVNHILGSIGAVLLGSGGFETVRLKDKDMFEEITNRGKEKYN